MRSFCSSRGCSAWSGSTESEISCTYLPFLLVGSMLFLLWALKARCRSSSRGCRNRANHHSAQYSSAGPCHDERRHKREEAAIPRALESYPSAANQTLAADTRHARDRDFQCHRQGVLLLAILHTFAAARFARLAHRVQHRHDEEARTHGLPALPSLRAEALHFFGEVGSSPVGGGAPRRNTGVHRERLRSDTVNYTEPLFVVVIMALAATRPIMGWLEWTSPCRGCWWFR